MQTTADPTVVLGTEDGMLALSESGEGVVAKKLHAPCVSPHDPNTIFVGGEPAAIFVSRDGGSTWSENAALSKIRRSFRAKAGFDPGAQQGEMADMVYSLTAGMGTWQVKAGREVKAVPPHHP